MVERMKQRHFFIQGQDKDVLLRTDAIDFSELTSRTNKNQIQCVMTYSAQLPICEPALWVSPRGFGRCGFGPVVGGSPSLMLLGLG
ncbi:hypothetical protein PAL_GLEAN10010652 [Pteropus alecto]|uniref:Uncharacterized protein n=1 Tax=Pteropus alecto TaxID=9402 RepID=L5KCL2_PTEAL|nr:hypothetical protein PAL_GLEAN10010652 [Pteropus alecto]